MIIYNKKIINVYDSKFYEDCMFESNFPFKTSYDNFFFFFKVLGPMFDTELLQHSKLKCTV